MSQERLKAFLAQVKGDASLQEKLRAAKSLDEVVNIAKVHGHEFSDDSFSQLTQEELERVSGGGNGCACHTRGRCILTAAAYPH